MKDSTTAIHAGFAGEPRTGATAVPVYQTVSYAHASAESLAAVFQSRMPGYVYTRIANPTTFALEARLAEMEQGIGCIATSSGMAAISAVAMALLRAGDEVVAAPGIFGGTISLFQNTLSRFGVRTNVPASNDVESFSQAVTSRTKLIFAETIANPAMDVPDIPALAELAHSRGIPLVVDSTVTTPHLIKPGRFGADIVVHSTSKFINGHGTAIGGAVIDTGNYDFAAGSFEHIREVAERAGTMAFPAYLRNVVYRDLGGCPAPMNSFLMLQGIETLPARMALHCENALKLAGFLHEHDKVAWINYPGLESSPYFDRVNELFLGRGGAILTFSLASRRRAFRFIDALRLAKNVANLGDAKTLVIHPASTIFHEFGPEQRRKMGVPDDLIRVSVGIEDFQDIRNDFEQAMEKAFEE